MTAKRRGATPPIAAEIEKLELAVSALEAQHAALGDAVVETALAALREKLKLLRQAASAVSGETRQRKLVTVLFADIPGFSILDDSMTAARPIWTIGYPRICDATFSPCPHLIK